MNCYNEISLVTIVTVTFNCKKLIESTISSVISQTYTNKEYIIVDGGSTDGTEGILERYRDCLDRFISEKDNGIYDAMNKGIRLASTKSKYITFLNAGDVYMDNDVIQKMMTQAKSESTNLYGNISVRGKILESPRKLNPFNLSTNTVCHQACFFQTETHRKFLYDTQYKLSADYKLLLELVRSRESFEKINITVAEMDVSGVSHSQRSLLRAENDKIRRMFSEVYFFYIMKNTINRLRRAVHQEKV